MANFICNGAVSGIGYIRWVISFEAIPQDITEKKVSSMVVKVSLN